MTVYLDRVDRYEIAKLESSIKNGLNKLGLSLAGKRNAVLKPNIVVPAKPNSGIITHPKVTEAVINVLRELGVEDISIAESSGIGVDVRTAFRVSGYTDLARRKKVKLLNMNELERTTLSWRFGKTQIPRILCQSDTLYVNLPKMKTHAQATVSLSMKNQKGILLPGGKKAFHSRFGLHEPIAELVNVISPDLIVVDGIVGMEGDGPINGSRKRANALVMGKGMLETDLVCCQIMGIDPSKVRHLTYAIEKHLGYSNPKLKGAKIEDLRTSFTPANEKYGRFLNVYSWRDAYACSMCIDAFSLALKKAIRSPRHWVGFIPKFIYLALFKRIDLFQGKRARVPPHAGIVLCLGRCTARLAEENNCTHVAGCPPSSEAIIDALVREI
jgi:uncharacterized protein (DUF362 family)